MKELITVFTPAYNRAYTLNLCYESLIRQTCKDFKWLIIDDGSTDNTKSIVDAWIADGVIPIQYFYKKNGGMHTAHNAAYELIDTELNICIDSDDYLPDDAIEKIVICWEKNRDDNVAGIIGLDATRDGRIIGTLLPNSKTKTTLTQFYSDGGKGDKKLVYRTDLMKKYPSYPEFEGEKYVSLAYKYTLCDLDYELIILNEILCYVEYLPDGSSKNMFKQYLKNPKGFAFIRKVDMVYSKKITRKFMNCVHYVSSSIISQNNKFICESPKKILTILAVPAGFILSIYVRSVCYWMENIRK